LNITISGNLSSFSPFYGIIFIQSKYRVLQDTEFNPLSFQTKMDYGIRFPRSRITFPAWKIPAPFSPKKNAFPAREASPLSRAMP
jgi:hypothetical protein